MDAYESNRKVELCYTPNVAAFRAEFEKHIEESVPLYIFVKSFTKFVHLMDNVDDDIKLLWRASRLLCSQQQRCLIGDGLDKRTAFYAGPVMMRAFSYFRLPVVAKEVHT